MTLFKSFCLLVTSILLVSVHSHDSHVIDAGCNDDVTIKVVTSARDSNNDRCAPPRVGKSGPKGEKGPVGEKGPQGDVGSVGPKGEQGVIGVKGEKGEEADACQCITNQQLLDRIDHLEELVQTLNFPKTCKDILALNPSSSSGVYKIYPFSSGLNDGLKVYCDMTTDGGGWIVFQKRQDGTIDFYTNWEQYVDGFGNVEGEYWLGLENIHKLTQNNDFELRIDLEDFENNRRFAKYSTFMVGGSDGYILSVSGYTGDAGDGFTFHNGQKFSTKDRDQDSDSSRSCASVYTGAWWYKYCHQANLNGRYLSGSHGSFADGVNWKHWRGNNYSLKISEMKIRRK